MGLSEWRPYSIVDADRKMMLRQEGEPSGINRIYRCQTPHCQNRGLKTLSEIGRARGCRTSALGGKEKLRLSAAFED